MNDRVRVAGGDFHRSVRLAGGRAADEQRKGEALAFHFAGDVRHFVQRGRNESAQADHIDISVAGRLKYFFARNHHAQVDDFVIVATKSDRLSGNQLRNALRLSAENLPNATVIPFSAKTGTGKEQLWQQIRKAIDEPAHDL